MRKRTTLPAFGACSLLLGLVLGTNAALAATSAPTNASHIVATVQSAPADSTVAGVHSAPGPASLPSTSPHGDYNGMLAIGLTAVALGVVLLRAKPAQVKSGPA